MHPELHQELNQELNQELSRELSQELSQELNRELNEERITPIARTETRGRDMAEKEMRILRDTIGPEADGMSVGQYLRQNTGLTKAQIRNLKFRENGICVNGNRVRVTQILHAGDSIELHLEDTEKGRVSVSAPQEEGMSHTGEAGGAGMPFCAGEGNRNCAGNSGDCIDNTGKCAGNFGECADNAEACADNSGECADNTGDCVDNSGACRDGSGDYCTDFAPGSNRPASAPEVLYEDEDLLIIWKQAGMLVHSASGRDSGLREKSVHPASGRDSGLREKSAHPASGRDRDSGLWEKPEHPASSRDSGLREKSAHPASGRDSGLREKEGMRSAREYCDLQGREAPQGTLSELAAAYLASRGETCVMRSIGRLDREASGIIVFAKNRIAASRLWEQRRTGAFRKEYLALCEGELPCDGIWHTIETPIARISDAPVKMCAARDGQPAVTHYQAIRHIRRAGTADICTFLRIHIDTGRTHQIRVHMASLGHPLSGDRLYGTGRGKLALCAWKVRLLQPFTGKPVSVCGKSPDFFTRHEIPPPL